MTRQERKHPDILKASRKKRIAAGAGVKVEEVNKLLKMHRNMADMMKAMGSGKRHPLVAHLLEEAVLAPVGILGGNRGRADEGDGRKNARRYRAGRHADAPERSSRRTALRSA